jgi:gamma-glutamyltranspeptidase / glutathione hydrolase
LALAIARLRRRSERGNVLSFADKSAQSPAMKILLLSRYFVTLAGLVTAFAAVAQNQAPEPPSGLTRKTVVAFKSEGVAAANPLAVDAGFRILKRGGSAVDAAIAVQLVLGLVEPQSSGIGGGAFALVHDGKSRKLRAYDGRETAPANATSTRFIGRDGLPWKFSDAVNSGKSVGVPGTVALLASMHKRHGKLAWKTLFEPAIELAETGFAVSPRLHEVVKVDRFLKGDSVAREYFYNADGESWPVGHTLRNPAYAATLRDIAANGAKAFYTGATADAIVAASRQYEDAMKRGDLTHTDLANYQVIERSPVCSTYRALKVCGFPPPSSGGIAIAQMLAALERHPMSAWRPNSVEAVHALSEAGRLAFADRGKYVADPDFVNVPPGLTDAGYMQSRGDLIHLGTSMKRAEPGVPPGLKAASASGGSINLTGTSHISVVDRRGNAVSMTTTIEDIFGARKMVSGFLLNNELTDFSMLPEEKGVPVANRVQAGKRPRSSMAPTIVYDRKGNVFIVVGSPGGSAIINYVAKTLVALIDWKLDPQAAIDLPNFGSRNGPTELEKGTVLESLKSPLESRGHSVNVMDFTSGLQALQRTYDANGKPNGWRGGADPRREGIVIGR